MKSFVSIVNQKSKNSVVLYRAISRDGLHFYSYIRCNEKQSHKMKHDFITKTACENIEDYGEVIYTALGEEPDDTAKDFLAKYLKNM